MNEMTADAWIEGAAVIRDPTGLHARPAVKLTKLAKTFEARVEIRGEGGGAWVNAKSPTTANAPQPKPIGCFHSSFGGCFSQSVASLTFGM